MEDILTVSRLHAGFRTREGDMPVISDVSLSVPAGGIVGIVGESGCGKSMTARAIMGLIQPPGRVVSGQILLGGRDLARLSDRERCALRGTELSMIFQEPMTSLNPVMTVGSQVREAVRIHSRVSRAEASSLAVSMLEEVGIPDAPKRMRCYPHELSGGLRQRVMIAMAMIGRPKLLIADEPTTALDVTVEAQILCLMKRLRDSGTSILLISHDLGVIARLCDRVYVMYAGRIVESADVFSLFDHPQHPYTRGLLEASVSLRRRCETLSTIPGSVPDLLRLPAGCVFSPRCGLCSDDCLRASPSLREVRPGHWAACHQTGGNTAS